jgi:hypothetical protein
LTFEPFSFLKVNPSDAGIYDRVVIQELIKTVASAQQLNAQGQRDFKVGVLGSPGLEITVNNENKLI